MMTLESIGLHQSKLYVRILYDKPLGTVFIYSFVVQQPKKMVRYLDNKVVTIKGERYTEIKEDAEASKEEAKKTFVALKPARQYRFH